MKKFKLCAYVDELASLSTTQEEEYEEIKDEFRRSVFGKHKFIYRTDILPNDIPPNTDVYVIDFGALSCYMMDARADRISRDLIAAIDNNPSTLFVLYSSFTVKHYQYIACEDKGLDCLTDLDCPRNVFLMNSYSIDEMNKMFAKIQALLGITS